MPACKLIFMTLPSCSKALRLWYSDLCIIQYQARIGLLRIKPVPSTTLRALHLFCKGLVQLFLKNLLTSAQVGIDRPKMGKGPRQNKKVPDLVMTEPLGNRIRFLKAINKST